MSRRPLVRNAASPRQVNHADRTGKDLRARQLADLKAVLDTEPGRRLLLRILTDCGIWKSVLDENVITMAAAAGQQNVGHYLRDRINEADPLMLVTMLREAHDARERENRETAAVQNTSDEENPDAD